ncbi:MAG: hypothetical protein NC244_10810 [Alistipes senegalensis]|nr:hypothetical protein [Alistipes senegalensis]
MTYEQINEMMEEMGLPFAYIILQKVKVPRLLFSFFFLPARIHFPLTTICISALNSWILNFIQILRVPNLKKILKGF